MTTNMYRVGDYVYFEGSSSAPYQIRRIEELNKVNNVVEARVSVFYRRRDISSALLKIADQAERRFEEYFDAEEGKEKPEHFGNSGHTIANGNDIKHETDGVEVKKEDDESAAQTDWGTAGLPSKSESLDTVGRHRLRQREVFMSRQVETLPATQIRGKCHVSLLSDVETPDSYSADDAFFYSLVYDPTQTTLLADKGAIRVGAQYQAEVPEEPEVADVDMDTENGENGHGLMIDETGDEETASPATAEKAISETEREVIVFHPYHSLSAKDIDQFLIMARAVGTFSRALDSSSSIKLPSLHMTAAFASRDVTILHALALLHQADYDIGRALKFLIPPANKNDYPLSSDKTTGHNTLSLGGPLLCRDQMEEWSAPEANLFEEALEKSGKDFNDVRNDWLPWKSMRDIIEYYYMWKTSNRYVEKKKTKHQDQESRLKQVYIPTYNKPNSCLVGLQLNQSGQLIPGTSPCESCQCNESTNWYKWGPTAHNLKLCNECWIAWRKYGGLKKAHQYESFARESNSTDNSASKVSQSSVVNPLAINKTSAAAQNRPIGAQQVVARLAPQPLQTQAMNMLATGAKCRAVFNLKTSLMTKVARRICSKQLFNLRRSARKPCEEINEEGIKRYCYSLESSRLVQAATNICTNHGATIPKNFLQTVIQAQIQYHQNANAKRAAVDPLAGQPAAKKAHTQ